MNRALKVKNRLFDRVSAFLMIMLVILNSTFMVPVHASFVPPVAAEIDVAVVSALSALGIGVSGKATTPEWLSFIHKICTDTVKTAYNVGVSVTSVGSSIQYHLSNDFVSSVYDSFQNWGLYAEKSDDLSSSLPAGAILSQQNVSGGLTTKQFYSAIGCPMRSDRNYSDIFNNTKISSYCVLQRVYYARSTSYLTNYSVDILGKNYFFENSDSAGNNYVYFLSEDKKSWNLLPCSQYYLSMEYGNNLVKLNGYLVSFQFVNSSSVDYYLVNTDGSTGSLDYFPTNFKVLTDSSSTPTMPMNDAQNSHFLPNVYAQGASVLTQPKADVQSKLNQKVGEKDSTGAYKGIVVSVPADANTSNPDKLRDATSTQTKVVGQEVATEADKASDDTYNQTKSKDTTPTKSTSMPNLQLPSGLQKKFPFCLPWDLAAVYKLFNVTPKAPVWTIPINIDQGFLHLHQTYTYDLNQSNVLDTVLPIFKWFLNVSFCIGLIFITKRIMT